MKNKALFSFVLLLFSLLALDLAGLTIPVNNQEPGWIQSIQLAIMTANDGDTILVYPGTYYENINFLGKNITVKSLDNDTQNTIINGGGTGNVVIIENTTEFRASLTGFTIQNGWALEPYPELGHLEQSHGGGILCRNAYANLNDLLIQDNIANRGGGIALIEDSQIGISGVEIINNQALPNNLVDGWGGGIYIDSSSVQIQFDNEIRNNHADVCGGGVYITNNASAYFLDTYMYDNTAHQGAGIYVMNAALNYHEGAILRNIAEHHGGGIFLNSPTYSNITTTNINLNVTPYDGGGVYVSNSEVNIRFQGCTIRNNSANRGGGVNLVNCSQFTIEGCLIHENTANNLGAGIWINHCNEEGISGNGKILNSQISSNVATSSGGGIDIRFSNCELSNSYISWNSGSVGGGVYVTESGINISECTINGNTATSSGGGLHLFAFDYANIEKTIIFQNTSPGDGAGIQSYGAPENHGRLEISSSLIRNNQTTDTGKGGGIYTAFCETRIVNSDIIGNISSNDGNGIYSHADCNLILINSILWENELISHPGTNGSLIARNSDIENYSVLSGNNDIRDIINQDPLFVDPLVHNYYLTESSPCIDTGINHFLWETQWGIETIIDIQPGEYYGDSIDIGCYEYVTSGQLYSPNVSIIIINNHDIRLDWEPVPGATYYKVYRSINTETWGEAIALPNQTTWIDQGATNSDKYFYRVTACN